jgi:hypothetical protein
MIKFCQQVAESQFAPQLAKQEQVFEEEPQPSKQEASAHEQQLVDELAASQLKSQLTELKVPKEELQLQFQQAMLKEKAFEFQETQAMQEEARLSEQILALQESAPPAEQTQAMQEEAQQLRESSNHMRVSKVLIFKYFKIYLLFSYTDTIARIIYKSEKKSTKRL